MQNVTATRRRPSSFDELKGQDFVSKTLRRAMSAGTVANAYLFSGPRGCGKTSTARLLAKALNCEATGKVNPSPCGKCASCRAISESRSVDVLEIDGASNTSVNDVRRIKEEILFPPNTSRYKIYIIDEVHMLSTSAFNALLKTIEEPPPFVVFIFATTELHKLPLTIKSRCQKYAFHLVDVKTIKSLLEDAAKEMKINAEEEALYFIAREGKGSIRDAYTLFDQVAAFSGGEITYEKIKSELGIIGHDALEALFSECAKNNTKGALLVLEEIFRKGIDAARFVSEATKFFRNLLFLKNGVEDEEILEENPLSFGETVRNAWSGEQLEIALSMFLDTHRALRYTLSAQAEIELAVSRLSWLSSYVSSREIKEMLGGTESGKLTDTEENFRQTQNRSESLIKNPAPSFSFFSPSAEMQGVNEAESEENGSAKSLEVQEGAKDEARRSAVTENERRTSGGVPLFSALKNPAAKKYALSESEAPKAPTQSFPEPLSKTDESTPKKIEASHLPPHSEIPEKESVEQGEEAKSAESASDMNAPKEKITENPVGSREKEVPLQVRILLEEFKGSFSLLSEKCETEK